MPAGAATGTGRGGRPPARGNWARLGTDHAANTAPSSGLAGPPGRLIRKTLNRQASPGFGGVFAAVSGVMVARPAHGRRASAVQPSLAPCASFRGTTALVMRRPIPLGQRLHSRPRLLDAQVADDVDGADLEFRVIDPRAGRVEEDLDHLFVPDVLVARCHRVPRRVVDRVEPHVQGLGVPERLEARAIALRAPLDLLRVVPQRAGGVDERGGRSGQPVDVVVPGGRSGRVAIEDRHDRLSVPQKSRAASGRVSSSALPQHRGRIQP